MPCVEIFMKKPPCVEIFMKKPPCVEIFMKGRDEDDIPIGCVEPIVLAMFENMTKENSGLTIRLDLICVGDIFINNVKYTDVTFEDESFDTPFTLQYRPNTVINKFIFRFNLVGDRIIGELPKNKCDPISYYPLPDGLEEYNISNNLITGEFDDALPTSIIHFIVSDNQLVGDLPTMLGLNNLETFDVSKNNFNVGVLSSLPVNLKVLKANSTNRTGSLPTLPNGLLELEIDDNDFSGLISSLPNSLTDILITNNNFSGVLPILPTNLVNFIAYGNSFTGNFPLIPNSLTILEIQDNDFSGSIPILSSSLITFNLYSNLFTGALPLLPQSLEVIQGGNNSLTSVVAQTNTPPIRFMNFQDNVFPSLSVDILIEVCVNGGVNGGLLALHGGNLAPTLAGENNIDILRSRSWTVIVTGGY